MSIKIRLAFLFCLLANTPNFMAQSRGMSDTDQLVQELLDKAHGNIHKNPKMAFQFIDQALLHKDEITGRQQLKLYRVTSSLYYQQQSYLFALEYSYKALALQKKIDATELHYIYNNIGCAYMQLGDSVKSRKFLYKSLEGLKSAISKGKVEEKNVEAYLVYPNLAVLEMEAKNYDKALEMFHICRIHSIRLGDTTGIVNTYQNLSNIYNKTNQPDSSRIYSDRAIHLAKKAGKSVEIVYLYYHRGVNFGAKDRDSAIYYLEKSFSLARKMSLADVKLSSSQELAALYDEERNYRKSLEYLRIANLLTTEIMAEQGKKKVELLDFENDQKFKKDQALARTKSREQFLFFAIMLLIPIPLSILLMYKLQKIKEQDRKQENNLLLQKMEKKNKLLINNTIDIEKASDRIDATHRDLDHLKSISDQSTKKMLRQILLDLKNGNQTFNKDEFEKLFMETDEAFYRKLLEKYPRLTRNEIRLCAFAKMNFSTKGISEVTQQSTTSILMAQSRLRRKICLPQNQSLRSFLKSF